MKVHVGWPMCNPVYIHLFIWWISLGLILVLFSAGPVSAQRNSIVDQIIIEGNTAIDSERIRSLMITKSGGLIRKNRLNFSDLIGDLEAIENVYRNSGFLDVTNPVIKPIAIKSVYFSRCVSGISYSTAT